MQHLGCHVTAFPNWVTFMQVGQLCGILQGRERWNLKQVNSSIIYERDIQQTSRAQAGASELSRNLMRRQRKQHRTELCTGAEWKGRPLTAVVPFNSNVDMGHIRVTSLHKEHTHLSHAYLLVFSK